MESDKQLLHRRADRYVDEYVDRFSLTGMQSPAGLAISLTLGRDTVEVKYEKLSSDGAGGMNATIDSDCIQPYRLDVATFQMPIQAAKGLAEALTLLVENAPQDHQAESKDANPV